MAGIEVQRGMSTVGTACSGSLAQDGSIGGEVLLDLNRSPPVDGDGDGHGGRDEAPTAADARASPVAMDLDQSPVAAAGACVAGGEGSQNEAPIAAGTRASPVVVDLERSPVAGGGGGQVAAGTRASPVVVDLDRSPGAGGGGSQNKAPISAGTRDSPIDVESLADEGRRNRTGTMRRRLVVVVDLEVDTHQQGGGDARTTFCRTSGTKRQRVPPVICISPDREKRTSNQRNPLVPFSRSSANAPPKEPVFTCPVCLNKMEQPSATSCGHVFCEKCIKASIKAQHKCPTCRKKLGPRGFRRVYLPATSDQV